MSLMGLRFTLAITGASGSAFGVAALKRLSANAAVDQVAGTIDSVAATP